jgi:hypothetical protein
MPHLNQPFQANSFSSHGTMNVHMIAYTKQHLKNLQCSRSCKQMTVYKLHNVHDKLIQTHYSITVTTLQKKFLFDNINSLKTTSQSFLTQYASVKSFHAELKISNCMQSHNSDKPQNDEAKRSINVGLRKESLCRRPISIQLVYITNHIIHSGSTNAHNTRVDHLSKCAPDSKHLRLISSRAKLASQSDHYKTIILFSRFHAVSKTAKFLNTKISGFVQHGEAEIRCSSDTNPSRGFKTEGS